MVTSIIGSEVSQSLPLLNRRWIGKEADIITRLESFHDKKRGTQQVELYEIYNTVSKGRNRKKRKTFQSRKKVEKDIPALAPSPLLYPKGEVGSQTSSNAQPSSASDPSFAFPDSCS